MSGSSDIVTFGCRLNSFESAVIRRLADAARSLDAPDTIIFNTCAVTAEAERQARQAIRRARRERPEARIVVTGCAAQVNPAAFAAMPEVDQVLGNAEKLDPSVWAEVTPARVRAGDIMAAGAATVQPIDGFAGRARAFVQAQQGCDHRCTFCIIPFGRGPSRSVPMGHIADQVRRLVANGHNEVVLTGVDITAYGPDLPGRPSLGQMVRRVLRAVPELPRLRLSSLDPVEVDDDLLDVIAREPRLLPHLHLSLQSGDDLVLKRMKRRHSRADAIRLCRRIRDLRPDTAFGADIIAGFPTETEAMFSRSVELIEECDLAFLHVFPFSARAGTPAARMPQVAGECRRERAARLRARGDAALGRFLATRIGRTADVLVERDFEGRSEHYAPVTVDRRVAPGSIVRTQVRAVEDGRLQGRIEA
ncbi:MAG: tRNA (N(6)-L-threonylcarbamoyladenosine(37)-C(2))-methylthiotransferase MtaB [Alphaproteobacteria bacterium]|nr:tRNA (N(6)-L-threonylcarbamoyladenosine(37)-C(2))-methylthiotransferase MtaB [Alphaproteobacteria bacterium]